MGDNIKMVDAPTQAHEASCHCGAIKYTIHAPSLQDPATQHLVACNCSICQKFGYLNIYPDRTAVEWHQGYPEMTKAYKFASKKVDHVRCRECDSPLMVDMKGVFPHGDKLAMNARMIKGLDIQKVKIVPLNGRELIGQEYNDKY